MDNWDPRRGTIVRYPSCLDHCCGMYLIPNPIGRWRDSPCYERHRVICERNRVPSENLIENPTNESRPIYRTVASSDGLQCRDHIRHPANGHIYHYNARFRGTYDESINYCLSMKGKVANFDSHEVQMFLLDQQSLSTGSPSIGVWLNGDSTNRSEHKHSSGLNYVQTFDPEIFDYEKHKSMKCVSSCCGVVRIGYYLDWNVNCDEYFGTICSIHITDSAKFDMRSEVESSDPNTACDHLFTHEFHNMEYHVMKENMLNLYESIDYCKSIGGQMVKVSNYKQSAFLKWITNNMHVILGAVKLNVESFHYNWLDNSQLNYSNWMIGRPSCVESCCTIIHEPTGKFLYQLLHRLYPDIPTPI